MIEAVIGKCLALCVIRVICVALLLTSAYRMEPYRDRPPSRDYRGRDPSFREPLPREALIRDVSPRAAPLRDMLPPAPAPVATATPSVPMQPASTIVVPPPEPQIDREKVSQGGSLKYSERWSCSSLLSGHAAGLPPAA